MSSLLWFLRDIKLAHSVFALPFAGAAYVLSGAPWPTWGQFCLLLLCMVSARSYAMGLNRWGDRRVDALNARTKVRMIPSGRLSASAALVWSILAGLGFLFAAWSLNPDLLWGAAGILLILGAYPWMKHITYLCHWYLGFCLALAPVAVSAAILSTVSGAVLCLAAAVMFWTAGFDLIYALHDIDFDRQQNLHSFPAKFGPRLAIYASRFCFVLMLSLLCGSAYFGGRGPLYFLGILLVAGFLAYEHYLIREAIDTGQSPNLNQAFFSLNGYVSVVFFSAVLLDVYFYGS